jgi:transposase
VYIDEAGFYLLAGAVYTYAPRGQTPVLRFPLTRDHLSVIGAITPDGKLYTMTKEGSFKGPDIVRFLRHLLRHIDGNLMAIWDGLPAHQSLPVREFLSQGGARRIHLERLPAYAPDLNPTEGIWHYLKHVELGNLCCHDFPELRIELSKAIARLRHKTHIIQGCIQHVHLGEDV